MNRIRNFFEHRFKTELLGERNLKHLVAGGIYLFFETQRESCLTTTKE